jgi:hypothetical protein
MARTIYAHNNSINIQNKVNRLKNESFEGKIKKISNSIKSLGISKMAFS